MDRCIVKGCPVIGYATSIDGKGGISWPLCSNHYEKWEYFLAGAESEYVIRTHTPKWNITMERFIDYAEKHINE
jgi:hypothetical protein